MLVVRRQVELRAHMVCILFCLCCGFADLVQANLRLPPWNPLPSEFVVDDGEELQRALVSEPATQPGGGSSSAPLFVPTFQSPLP